MLIARADGDCEMKQVPVTLAWCSLGDYDNIFAYRRLAPTGPCVGHIRPMSLVDLDIGNIFDYDCGIIDEDSPQLLPGRMLLSTFLPEEANYGIETMPQMSTLL